MKKVTEQELEELRKANSTFNTLKLKLAEVEIETKRLSVFKESVFQELEDASSEFKELEKSLVEAYGNVNVNLNTGDITEEATND